MMKDLKQYIVESFKPYDDWKDVKDDDNWWFDNDHKWSNILKSINKWECIDNKDDVQSLKKIMLAIVNARKLNKWFHWDNYNFKVNNKGWVTIKMSYQYLNVGDPNEYKVQTQFDITKCTNKQWEIDIDDIDEIVIYDINEFNPDDLDNVVTQGVKNDLFKLKKKGKKHKNISYVKF